MAHWFSDLTAFRHEPLQFLLARAAEASEPLVRLSLGPQPTFLLTEPELIKPLLKADEADVDKGRLVHKLRAVVGNSSLVISGEEHHQRRAAAHPHLAKGCVERLVPQLCAEIRTVVSQLAGAGQYYAHTVTAPLALKLISIPIFGHQALTGGDDAVIVRAVQSVEDDLAEDMFRLMPLLPWAWLARHRRRRAARRAIGVVINRARRTAGAFCVMRSLEARGLNDADLRDEILTMLIAGHHTTGSAAAWLFYHLAIEPGLMDALAQECAVVTDENGEVSADRLKHASLSQTVVKEVLRLYPSAWWFSRETKRRITLGGRAIKKRTTIIVSPWQLHRDPRFWQEPNSFRLDRDYAQKSYIPFGVGPRACLGMGAAMLELQLLALEMASAFRFELERPLVTAQPYASITLIPPPLALKIRLRQSELDRQFDRWQEVGSLMAAG